MISPASTSQIIAFRELTYSVAIDPVIPILRDVNLTVNRGEFVAIVGPSGSGKSTLLNILGLLDRATSGVYELEGSDVSVMTSQEVDRLRAEFFGFVFQASHVIGDDSVARNVSLGLRIRGIAPELRDQKTEEVLVQVGLSHKWSSLGSVLSGGEKQRVAIARALAGEPTVILADEPTGNLDSANSEAVIALLTELHKAGNTVVVVTHDERVAQAAQRRLHVNDGQVVATEGVPSQHIGTHARLSTRVISHRSRARDLIGDALSALAARPFRTLSLAAAFALGAGSLVAAIGLSETASAQVSDRLAQAAYDEIRTVLPSGTTVTDATLFAATIETLDGTKLTTATLTVGASESRVSRFAPHIESDQSINPGLLYLADSKVFDVAGASVSAAHSAWLLDGAAGQNIVFLGAGLAKDLEVAESGIGQQVWIQGRPFQVVGIISESSRFPTLTQSAVVPLSAMQELNTAGEKIRLVTRTELGFPAPLAEAIPLALRPNNPGSIEIETVADLRQLQRGVQNDLGVYVGALSILLLVLASLSASATMYVAVRSRSGEIALRRALGASSGLIRRMFLVEGVLVGIGGGIAGASFGILATVAFSAANGWTPVMTPTAPVLGVMTGLLTGAVAAIVPAELASRVDPATAIRTNS